MKDLYRLSWQFRLMLAIGLFMLGFILGTAFCYYVEIGLQPEVPEQLRHYP